MEKEGLDSAFYRLTKHVNFMNASHILHGMAEDFVIKYFWGAIGLVVCALPVFLQTGETGNHTDVGDRTKDFITNRC